ncbi:MAG TPA: formate dehydrogenase accessory sulfurtransferase FdhD [Chloroflexota bacterium]|jgi:FdhD protein|nr:formate dehydrogenase accessory sulfurtransferase FdhD [Chloroflexota bacterium]
MTTTTDTETQTEPRGASTPVRDVVRWSGLTSIQETENLATEEPLEIRLAGIAMAVTMRTPGDDIELVTGFLLTEGIVKSLGEISSIAHCRDDAGAEEQNVVNVNLRDAASFDVERLKRNFYSTSSCGICGKASIDAVRLQAGSIPGGGSVEAATLYRLPDRLLAGQKTFRATGGLHAAGLFDFQGECLVVREDVGRHNAVDKVIGWSAREAPERLRQSILMVSGRASFEVVQKALMAWIPLVAAVSAPSSLAVDLARTSGMTLVGFLRPEHFNVYAGAERVVAVPVPTEMSESKRNRRGTNLA